MADHPVRNLRLSYDAGRLLESEVRPDPLDQFRVWFDDALQTDLAEPNAMTLATIDADGRPAARVVLLRGFDERGLVFYTNYGSAKGLHLGARPLAALVFWWPPLERQVRIVGAVARVSAAESDAYFQSRPRESRLGAISSEQSRPVADRAALEARFSRTEAMYEGRDVPRPDDWGGFRVAPDEYEFWQGRPARMHDRIRYRRDDAGEWAIERLRP